MTSDHEDPRVRLLYKLAHSDRYGASSALNHGDTDGLFPEAPWGKLSGQLMEAAELSPGDPHCIAALNALGLSGAPVEGSDSFSVLPTLGARREYIMPILGVSLRTLINYENSGFEKIIRNYDALRGVREADPMERRIRQIENVLAGLIESLPPDIYWSLEEHGSLLNDFLKEVRDRQGVPPKK